MAATVSPLRRSAQALALNAVAEFVFTGVPSTDIDSTGQVPPRLAMEPLSVTSGFVSSACELDLDPTVAPAADGPGAGDEAGAGPALGASGVLGCPPHPASSTS